MHSAFENECPYNVYHVCISFTIATVYTFLLYVRVVYTIYYMERSNKEYQLLIDENIH